MSGPRGKPAFTLIEVLVVIAIIALMATIVIPNLRPTRLSVGRQTFIAQLNELTQFAWRRAVTTRLITRLLFDFSARTARVEQQIPNRFEKGEPQFEPARGGPGTISWSTWIQIRHFAIDGFDEMSRAMGNRKTEESWFYVMPDGITQQVTIGLVDTKDVISTGKPRSVTLEINPFTAQFKVTDGATR